MWSNQDLLVVWMVQHKGVREVKGDSFCYLGEWVSVGGGEQWKRVRFGGWEVRAQFWVC